MASPDAAPFTARSPTVPTANTLTLNPYLLYHNRQECVLDFTQKGLSDVRAAQICDGFGTTMGQNGEDVGVLSINSVGFWETEENLVIPVTLTSEGVQNNAYKSYAELQKAFKHVENTPITILHPPGRGVMGLNEVHGWVRDTWFDPKNAAWKGNAYFVKGDKALAEMGHDETSVKAHNAILDAIRLGAKLDGSIGYYHQTITENGNFNGRPYGKREVNIMVDHFAIVDRGASSWHDGTGFGKNDQPIAKPEGGGGGAGVASTNDVYDSTHTGKGQPPHSTTLSGWTSNDGGHRHRFTLYRGLTTNGAESLTFDCATDGSTAHVHEWNSVTSTSTNAGHSHSLPPFVNDWLTSVRAAEQSEDPAKVRSASIEAPRKRRFYDFLIPAKNAAAKPSFTANLRQSAKSYKGFEKSIKQENPSMDDQDKQIVGSLSLNTLADLNPDVKALRDQVAAATSTVRDLTANAERSRKETREHAEKVKTLEAELSVFKANAKKTEDAEKARLVSDIIGVTGEKADVYASIGLNELRITRTALSRAFSADNSDGDVGKKEPDDNLPKAGKKEAASARALQKEGMGSDKKGDDDESDEDDESINDEEDLKVALADAEDGDGYEDYLKPAAKVPAPGAGGRSENRSDRSLVAARAAASRRAQAQRRQAPSENSAPAPSIYESVFGANQSALRKKAGDA